MQDVTRLADWHPETLRILRGENSVAFEQAIAAGATGTPVRFMFRRPLVLVAMQVTVLSADVADLAAIELAWEDEWGQPIATDGYVPTTLNGAAASCGGRARNRRGRWHPLEQVVEHGQVHTFTVTNNHATNTITPSISFRVVPLRGGPST